MKTWIANCFAKAVKKKNPRKIRGNKRWLPKYIKILLSLEIIGRLKRIVLSNHQCAAIHLVVSTYKCEETSLSREAGRKEANGAYKCLMWPALEKDNNLLCKDNVISTLLTPELSRGKKMRHIWFYKITWRQQNMMRKWKIQKIIGLSMGRQNSSLKL